MAALSRCVEALSALHGQASHALVPAAACARRSFGSRSEPEDAGEEQQTGAVRQAEPAAGGRDMHSLGELTLAEAVHQRQHLALYAAAAPAISASSSGRGSGEQPRWPAATGGSQLLGGFLSRVGARESSSLDSVGKKPPPPGSMAALTSTAAAAADSSLFESETIQGEQAWAVWRPQADDARAAPLTLGEALAATRMGPGQPSYAEF